jgi:recombination protein RecA
MRKITTTSHPNKLVYIKLYIDLGVEHITLEKKGSWVTYKGKMIGQIRETATQHLIDTPELTAEWTGLIMDKVQPKAEEAAVGAVEDE